MDECHKYQQTVSWLLPAQKGKITTLQRFEVDFFVTVPLSSYPVPEGYGEHLPPGIDPTTWYFLTQGNDKIREHLYRDFNVNWALTQLEFSFPPVNNSSYTPDAAADFVQDGISVWKIGERTSL